MSAAGRPIHTDREAHSPVPISQDRQRGNPRIASVLCARCGSQGERAWDIGVGQTEGPEPCSHGSSDPMKRSRWRRAR